MEEAKIYSRISIVIFPWTKFLKYVRDICNSTSLMCNCSVYNWKEIALAKAEQSVTFFTLFFPADSGYSLQSWSRHNSTDFTLFLILISYSNTALLCFSSGREFLVLWLTATSNQERGTPCVPCFHSFKHIHLVRSWQTWPFSSILWWDEEKRGNTQLRTSWEKQSQKFYLQKVVRYVLCECFVQTIWNTY